MRPGLRVLPRSAIVLPQCNDIAIIHTVMWKESIGLMGSGMVQDAVLLLTSRPSARWKDTCATPHLAPPDSRSGQEDQGHVEAWGGREEGAELGPGAGAAVERPGAGQARVRPAHQQRLVHAAHLGAVAEPAKGPLGLPNELQE